MTMHTTARDEALLQEIAEYFDMLASDSEEFAARGIGSKRENLCRAKVWREAASDVRSIRLDPVPT
jgi:hypothetical protein